MPQRARSRGHAKRLRRLGWALGTAAMVSGASPALAVDVGDRIAFTGQRNGSYTYDLFSMRPDGAEVRALTNTPADNEFSGGSNFDGSLIAFTRTPVGSGGSAPPPDVYVMRADGSDVRRVTNTPTVGEYSPRVSPDGQRVAYQVYDPALDAVDVHVTEVSGRTSRITDDGLSWYPAWSPDGERLAFVRARMVAPEVHTIGIWVMRADGSDARPVTATAMAGHLGSWDIMPVWSPDGRLIAFSRTTGSSLSEAWVAQAGVYVVRPDGTGLTRLTTAPNVDWNPAWSLDGSRITFDRVPILSPPDYRPELDPVMDYGLYSMNPDGSDLTRLTRAGWWSDWGTTWVRPVDVPRDRSPGGEAVAQTTTPVRPTSGRVRIQGNVLHLSRRGIAWIGVRCLPVESTVCRGRLRLHAGPRVLGSAPYVLPAGAAAAVRVRVDRFGRRHAGTRRLRAVRVLAVSDGVRVGARSLRVRPAPR